MTLSERLEDIAKHFSYNSLKEASEKRKQIDYENNIIRREK